MSDELPLPEVVTDTTSLDRLRRIGGDPLVRELIELFRTLTPVRLAAARRGAENGDAPEIERAVHALKSSSGQLGARDMQELCQRAEDFAAHFEIAPTGPILDALEREFAKVEARLSRFVQKPTSAPERSV